MIGAEMAHTPRPPRMPSRDEIERRLEALTSRVLSRRGTDDHLVGPEVGHHRDNDEIEAETLARLRALEARVAATMEDRP